jgi:hypothetical protein
MHQLARLTTEGLKEWSDDPIDVQGAVIKQPVQSKLRTVRSESDRHAFKVGPCQSVVATDT